MKTEKEIVIPVTEDLMKEHGILNRVLLIYEEIIRRIDHADFQASLLAKALEIIKSFIEEYHEKNEENYIFPLFEKMHKETKLVKTLRDQHIKGRKITTRLQELAALDKHTDAKVKKEIKQLLEKFIRMYRPHETREDTVLFPQVRLLLGETEFKELSEKMEDSEHELFGPEGFEGILKKVEHIEKALNIYALEKFTPDTTTK